MHEFRLHRASSVDEAVAMFNRAPNALYLAGGQTLIPSLKFRLASPSDVLDVGGIAALKGIELRDTRLRIGALETHASVAEAPLVRARLPVLADLAVRIGDQMVRNRGTIGGSIATNDPGTDYPAAVLGLGATLQTDRRTIHADELFRGMGKTALTRGELIVAVDFPLAGSAAYVRFPRLLGVFLARLGGRVRAAVTTPAACVHRAPELERALAARFHQDAVDDWTPDPGVLGSDSGASAAYRAQLLKVGVRRAVAAMAGVTR